MRKDFNRVLTEDPRRGSRSKFSQVRRSKLNATFDEEFSGGKESMMTQRRNQKKQNRKTFGDLLTPLEGWVRKQVGKKWDDVYSEVCELFDRRSQIKDHVHQHLFDDYVERNTALIDGKVCIFSSYDGYKPVTESTWRRRSFYIHPVTGILCDTYKENEPGHSKKLDEAKAAKKAETFREHDRDTHLYFDDGLWYVYHLKNRPVPHIEYRCPNWWRGDDRRRWETMTEAERAREGSPVWVKTQPKDEVQAPNIGSHWYYRNYCPADRYYCDRRVANRRLLKAHGLVGTATFKPEEGTLSHRERSKYRQT